MIIEPPDGGVLTTSCRILSLLRNYIYQSPRRHLLTTYASQHTHFPILFRKLFFKFFGSLFPGPQGLLPTIFEFPYSCYTPSNFFRRFNLISHILLHNVEPPDDRQLVHVQTGVTNLWAVAHTWPVFFPPHPYARTLLCL